MAHDYLTQRGGAERVVLSMLRAFPQATVVTSVYSPATTFAEFGDYDVRTTWLQRLPLARRDPRRALPLLARAFSKVSVPDADVVLCSSSGWAHGVSTTAPKIVYCHNPPRWLHQSSDYTAHQPLPVRLAVEVLRNRLTGWDRSAAASAETYLANSTTVRDRILRAYGIDAEVVPPPVGIDVTGPREPVPGVRPGFLLNVSRPRGYKNSHLVAEAVASLAEVDLFMVGGLPERSDGAAWPENLYGARDLTDAQMRWLYANCSGLLAVSHEDFGLTPLEANAFGKPVACLRAGGYLDSLAPEVSGVFIERLSLEHVRDGIRRLRAGTFHASEIVAHAAAFDEQTFGRRLRAVVDQVLRAPDDVMSTGPRTVDVTDRQDEASSVVVR